MCWSVPSTCTLPPLTGECSCGAQSADEPVNSSCVQPNLVCSLKKGVLMHKLPIPPLSIGTSKSQVFSINYLEQRKIGQGKLQERWEISKRTIRGETYNMRKILHNWSENFPEALILVTHYSHNHNPVSAPFFYWPGNQTPAQAKAFTRILEISSKSLTSHSPSNSRLGS